MGGEDRESWSAAAKKLMDTGVEADFQAADASYGAGISALNRDPKIIKLMKKMEMERDLVKLDEFVKSKDDLIKSKTLSGLVKTQGHLTLEQLKQVLQWKMLRGKWRPLMKGLSERNSSTQVVSVTEAAFKQWWAAGPPHKRRSQKDVKACVEKLSELFNVGPALASAVAGIVAEHGEVPYMADEALDAVMSKGVKGRDYSVKANWTLLQALTEKAEALNKAAKKDGRGKGEEGGVWTAQRVGDALFGAAMAERFKATETGSGGSGGSSGSSSSSNTGKSGGGSKRKASAAAVGAGAAGAAAKAASPIAPSGGEKKKQRRA